MRSHHPVGPIDTSFLAARCSRKTSSLVRLGIDHQLALLELIEELADIGGQLVAVNVWIHPLEAVQELFQITTLGVARFRKQGPDVGAHRIQSEITLGTGAEEHSSFVHLPEQDGGALRRKLSAQR